MPSSRIRLAVAAVALAFFMLPGALLAVGVRAEPFENRKLAGPPKLDHGWQAFDETTRYVIDHLPLRQQAVRANTWVHLNIFGNAPSYARGGAGAGRADALPFGAGRVDRDASPRGRAAAAGGVVVGKDGWLFLRRDFELACRPPVPIEKAVARWRRFISIVRNSGRKAVLVVVPDKSSIYPEELPATFTGSKCGPAGQERLLRLLDTDGRWGVVSLHQPLVQAKAANAGPVYLRADTHWTAAGALTLAEQTLPRLHRTLRIAPGEARPGPDKRVIGDLSRLLGAPQRETAATLRIRRKGRARLPGRTLTVGDSFWDTAGPLLHPYLAHERHLRWNRVSAFALIRAMRGADTVIFQTVIRNFDPLASDRGVPDQPAYVKPRLFHLLRPALRGGGAVGR
jgi:alginate O-acetyltransferase complex protein AlgJ